MRTADRTWTQRQGKARQYALYVQTYIRTYCTTQPHSTPPQPNPTQQDRTVKWGEVLGRYCTACCTHCIAQPSLTQMGSVHICPCPYPCPALPISTCTVPAHTTPYHTTPYPTTPLASLPRSTRQTATAWVTHAHMHARYAAASASAYPLAGPGPGPDQGRQSQSQSQGERESAACSNVTLREHCASGWVGLGIWEGHACVCVCMCV
jgi:hypothetical protein